MISDIIKLLLGLGIICGGLNAAEVKKGADIYAPFKHKPFYSGERELLGYKPHYVPGQVTFDENNIPYIRTGDGYIQTLDKDGKWIKYDFKKFIKTAYPNWKGEFFKGSFAEERVVFDSTGDAYMHVIIDRKSPDAKSLILYSRDHCRTWQVCSLPGKFSRGWFVKIENASPGRRLPAPPVISLFNSRNFYLIVPEKTKHLKLKLSSPVLVSDSALMSITHSGGGNFTATIPGKSYVVFSGSESQPGRHGTPQFITTFDHKTKRCAIPVYMGSNGRGKPDNHNLPAVELDSKGYIHVFLGSHHDPFVYFQSKKPYDTSEWRKPERIGIPKTKMAEGSYTYIGIICDPFDNLHLVARWAGAGYKNYLIYLRKPAGKSWGEQKILVEPFKTLYSVYYHKMSQDLLGRILINYSYYGNELTNEQAAAYNKKWPEEKIFSGVKERLFPNGIWYKVKSHDPVVIVSNDSGNSFRLALTEDFAAGIKKISHAKKAEDNSVGMPMVEIPSGAFIMGSLRGAYDEKPLRPVFFKNKILMGKYPVRVKDFEKFVRETGYKTEFERITDKKKLHNWCGGKFAPGDKRTWRKPGFIQTEDDPVVLVTINDAKAFCKWLSKKENAVYRLPTEAEWEYACRAGSVSDYSFGDDSKVLPRYAWYKANAVGTKPVGMLLPNFWGLYDMNGNVWEYCADYYIPGRSDLPAVAPCQRKNKISGPVIRGGSWIDDWYGDTNGVNLRSATRYHIVYPLLQVDWVGFRIVKEVNSK